MCGIYARFVRNAEGICFVPRYTGYDSTSGEDAFPQEFPHMASFINSIHCKLAWYKNNYQNPKKVVYERLVKQPISTWLAASLPTPRLDFHPLTSHITSFLPPLAISYTYNPSKVTFLRTCRKNKFNIKNRDFCSLKARSE